MEPLPDVQTFFEALSSEHWPLVVSIGLTFVVWGLRNFVKDKIPSKYIPYITLSISILTSVSTRMSQAVSEDKPWWHGLIQGLLEGTTIGLTAMGAWSSGMKNLPIRK